MRHADPNPGPPPSIAGLWAPPQSGRRAQTREIRRILRVIFAITLAQALLASQGFADGKNPDSDQLSSAIRDRLVAGEIPAALELAQRLTDPAAKSRALAQIHQDHLLTGDLDGAATTARMLPRREERGALGSTVSRERSRQGGASVADFTDLIDLITSTVSPDSWDTVGGAGSVKPYVTGVFVDPAGELKLAERQAGPALTQLAKSARTADLEAEMSRATSQRIVSLRRLDAAASRCIERGEPLPETLRHLAGLRRIERVFFDPETHDVLLSGPAGGWVILPDGRAWASDAQTPVMNLDDLVVLLRALWNPADSRIKGGQFGCSINTREDNLKDLREFVADSQSRGPLRPGQLRGWVRQLRERLGLQDVEVFGVPADTHVARVLVEADYRMKLIGVGQIEGGPGIPSYFELLEEFKATQGVPLEALRWWLTMRYDAVLHSPDRLAFELVGGGVLVQSENQYVNARGQHVPTGFAEPINRAFAENFTRHYADLARRDPVFAELRNLFDLALVLTVAREEGWVGAEASPLPALGPRGVFQPGREPAPKVVESVVAHRVYNQTDIVVQVAGGVQIDLKATALTRNRVQATAPPDPLPGGDRWWWNAQGSSESNKKLQPR